MEVLDNNDLTPLIIDLAVDVWRLTTLSKALSLPQKVQLIIERLQEDFVVNNIEIIDPLGQIYHKNDNFEVMYIGDGEGQLQVSETISPGIRVSTALLARPKVCLAPTEVK